MQALVFKDGHSGAAPSSWAQWIYVTGCVTFDPCHLLPLAWQKPPKPTASVNEDEDAGGIPGTVGQEERLTVCWKGWGLCGGGVALPTHVQVVCCVIVWRLCITLAIQHN